MTVTDPRTDILSQIPSLEDHAEYKACLDRLADLETRLVNARNEKASLGAGPQVHGVHHQDDLDAEVSKHLQATEKHEKASIRTIIILPTFSMRSNSLTGLAISPDEKRVLYTQIDHQDSNISLSENHR